MVILSVSVCNKKGKILLARQYVAMTRLRIEGLLAAFPKLIDSDERTTSKQHTFIETNEVRYIYQPMDTLYLLLITNMQSNILEDLSTLRMIAKLIPEYCGGHDEETVSEQAFNLLYALDEVVTPMGYRDPVNYKQIEDYVKMDSAEEKLVDIIEKSKIETQREVIKSKIKEFDKKRAEERKRGSPGSFGYKGLKALESFGGIGSRFGSRGSQSGSSEIAKNAISSDDYNNQFQSDGKAGNVRIEHNTGSSNYSKKYGNNDDDNDDSGYSGSGRKKKTKPRSSGKGMRLGGKKARADQLTKDAMELDKKTLNEKQLTSLESMKTGHGYGQQQEEELIDAADLAPVEIMISEKLYLTFDRDGAMKKFEVKGDMEVAVNDPNSTQCVIETNILPNKKLKFAKPTWRLHPRMDASKWKKGILCLKDSQKKFRVGRSSKTSILKWRMTTDNDELIPISFTFWPESEGNGECTISAQYTANIALKNVIITFPTPTSQEPDITTCDNGDYAFNRNHSELQWILNDLDAEAEGTLEYIVEDVQLEDLWPVSIHFEIENTYSQIQIRTVRDTENEDEYEYTSKGTCVAEKYIVE